MKKNYNLKEILEEAIRNEENSARLYKSLGIWCDIHGLKGCANYFYKQTKDELEHAMKFIRYAVDVGIEVKLQELPSPSFKLNNIKDAFAIALQAEQKLTSKIHEFYKMSTEAGDIRTMNFLNNFIQEQLKEELKVREIMNILDQCGLNPPGLFLFDEKISKMNE